MPDKNFLGIERLSRRVERTCRKAEKVDNMRVLNAETSYAVRYLLPENSVETFYLLFPDPWPKRRRQRRRIFSDDFLDSITAALEENQIPMHLETAGGTRISVAEPNEARAREIVREVTEAEPPK